jgi:hypothetical protein
VKILTPETSLREAFLVFISLAFIALLNSGQAWESHKTSSQYMNWELNSLLKLSNGQMERINAIDAACDFELEKISCNKKLTTLQKEAMKDDLLVERSEGIMKILNNQQQELLYAYCADLLIFNKVFE